MACARLAWATSKCSLAPEEALTTAGVTVTVWRSGSNTPCTPTDFGRAQQRAQVLRILEGIQDQHEQRLAAALGQHQDILQIAVRIVAGFERDALVVCRLTTPAAGGDTLHR